MGKSADQEPDTPFGKWLRAEFDRRGYGERGGQTRFAKESGVHISVIYRLVAGQGRTPELDVLRRIGRTLGYTLAEMLVAADLAASDELSFPDRSGEETTPLQAPKAPPRYDNPAMQHIWEIPDDDLDDDQRGALVQMYRAIRRTADRRGSQRNMDAPQNRRYGT
ncbi:helix-turn-helix domain-containing protein [Microtetraspora malaysiensis]|uniref:Helix-turn-helix domain-containing protein n=1 Tax=Microtetraspora malaysiensis TaxID=161358 RepID=A0ABW6SK86_9ACTN